MADLSHDASAAQIQGRKLSSIFFGGGTPSLFSPSAIGRIIAGAEQTICFEPDIEITMEANPGTVEQDKFNGFHAAGINRLSIGIQSFNDAHLNNLGRIHSGSEAIKALTTARKAGFNNINLDLMHGLADQTPEQALADLQQAIDLETEHLSWYQLTIEPNTAFYNSPPRLPIESTLECIQRQGHALLATAGFKTYEVSAYAKTHRQSRHNINYWQFGDYLGIGAGAHGKISDVETKTIIRTRKTRQPQDYLSRLSAPLSSDVPLASNKNPYLAEHKLLDAGDLPLEFMMNALRLKEGAPLHLFTARTGMPLACIETPWKNLEAKGLVEPLATKRLMTTALGHRFLDSVLAEF